ncbi:MAG: alpha-glucan family phosphorylase [Thermodesulfobacteriota bacterium]
MHVRRLIVQPNLPPELQGLRKLAMNLWFSWHPDVTRMFQALDPDLWEETGCNPVLMLANLSPERKEEVVRDAVILEQIREAERALDDYISSTKVYSFKLDRPIDYRIAYFSMEFGLNECLPMYSGGLGVLAGDHLKSASNLGLPLVAVGLLYQKGYFKQYLNIDGWQQESYPDNDFYNMAVTPVHDSAGEHFGFELPVAERTVKVLLWKVDVGRIRLYLLDTNHPSNSPADRAITAELYGGDGETRMRQEFVLGIGGARALHLLGLWPFVYHLNEGHAAFAALERIRQTMTTNRVPFEVALEAAAASTVFTSHTPVAAGIDLFPPDLVERYFKGYMSTLGLSVADLMALGRENPFDQSSPLSMAVLALRVSRGVNGVSKLHSQVAKRMWSKLWPDVDKEDIPIGYVTNGVHIPSYVSKELADLFERYLGEGWIEEPDNEKVWSRVHNIPRDELWRVHESRRERLVIFCRDRLSSQSKARGGSPADQSRIRDVLNPDALTIGFARRFAPYKRAGLLFSDPDRLYRIISDKNRPVQFIFSGKAHPRDGQGKELIKMVVHQARSEGFRRNLVFLEDYDLHVARYLVQGVDVWLNTPRRPNEACGTSGMKAAANGALNMSILDGWWVEGYNGANGWAIGSGEELDDPLYQDQVEARLMYELLENEVVPLFFERGPDGLPHGWIEMMKNSMASICVRFNSHRMIEEYMDDYYIPAGTAHQALGENRYARARGLSEWRKRVRGLWKDVKVLDVSESRGDRISLGEYLTVKASIQLGGLGEHEVLADLCHGRMGPDRDQMIDKSITAMVSVGKSDDGVAHFEGTIHCDDTGVYGYNIRVVPFHPFLFDPLAMNLVTWG